MQIGKPVRTHDRNLVPLSFATCEKKLSVESGNVTRPSPDNMPYLHTPFMMLCKHHKWCVQCLDVVRACQDFTASVLALIYDSNYFDCYFCFCSCKMCMLDTVSVEVSVVNNTKHLYHTTGQNKETLSPAGE